MKKILLSAALCMGAFVFANAQTSDENQKKDSTETKTENQSESFTDFVYNDYYMLVDTTETPTEKPAEKPTEKQELAFYTDTVKETPKEEPIEKPTESKEFYMYSDTITDTTKTQTELAMVSNDEEYKVISLKELCPKAQNTLNTNYQDYTIKKVSYNETKKLTKVVLVSNTDQSEETIVINENGEVVEEK